MKTKTKLLLPLLFFAALLLVPALTLYGLVKSPSGWSVEENRALADVPEASLQGMLDGTLAQDLETFYSDHIFARRQLLKLDTLLQMKLLHRPAVHDVVLGDTVLLPAPGFSMKLSGEAREAQAVSIAEGLQSVKSAAVLSRLDGKPGARNEKKPGRTPICAAKVRDSGARHDGRFCRTRRPASLLQPR